MIVETIPVGVFQCNCTILGCEATRQALVVDPGDDPERIIGVVRAHRLQVTAVVHTHAHLDHIMGTFGVVEATGAPARLHRQDRRLWESVDAMAEQCGIPTPPTPELSTPLEDGDTIGFGEAHVRVIHTPGHTPGSCCFLFERGDGTTVLLSGDTLFRGRIGTIHPYARRTAAPERLIASIRERLLTLDDDTRVVPGHGPDTCIGVERRSNPFLCGA